MRCVPADSERKKFVVFGITAGSYFDIHIDPLCFSRQRCEKAPDVVFVDIRLELLTVKNLEQLRQHGIREQHRTLPLRPVHCHP
jgi:hypothetical protein